MEKKLPEYIASKGELAMKRYEEFTLFRQNFKILRASMDVSGESMAEHLNLKSTKRVYDYECGRCHPSFDEMRSIAKYFNVTLDQLIYQKAKITFD